MFERVALDKKESPVYDSSTESNERRALNYPRNSILHLTCPGCEWSFTSDAYLCWLTLSSPTDRENCLNLSRDQSAVVKAHFIDQTLIVGATRLTFWSVGALTLSNEKVTYVGKPSANRTRNDLQGKGVAIQIEADLPNAGVNRKSNVLPFAVELDDPIRGPKT